MAALIQPSINGSLPSPQTSAHLHRTFKCSNVPEETRASAAFPTPANPAAVGNDQRCNLLGISSQSAQFPLKRERRRETDWPELSKSQETTLGALE